MVCWWFPSSSIAISVSAVSRKAANGVIFGRIWGRGAIVDGCWKVIIIFETRAGGVWWLFKVFFFFFFETKREGVTFVKFFFSLRYSIK